MTDLLSAYLEGALPEDQAGAFDEHLDRCAACRAYLDSVKGVGRLARAATAEEAIPAEVQAMAAALLARFRSP
jgi:predicted anti-sigma-YlaC factor YlaD